jgi:hypothetical protein
MTSFHKEELKQNEPLEFLNNFDKIKKSLDQQDVANRQYMD